MRDAMLQREIFPARTPPRHMCYTECVTRSSAAGETRDAILQREILSARTPPRHMCYTISARIRLFVTCTRVVFMIKTFQDSVWGV
ncbi:hypothetical protein J6590_062381 [Homalodisca vitripennis]|nr:hypothetical protein J6590_062381 [Homalodisca vitripennis]